VVCAGRGLPRVKDGQEGERSMNQNGKFTTSGSVKQLKRRSLAVDCGQSEKGLAKLPQKAGLGDSEIGPRGGRLP